jgi:Tfp pilus assembly protein PilN
MIQVNLLPGAKRAKSGGGGMPSINFAAIGAAITERVKDKYLAAAVISGVVAALVIGGLYTMQARRASSIAEAEEKAVADSARFAAVLLDRSRAQARRDSALIQLNIIRAIDDDRFVWPHVLDEISRALPQFTWLRNVNFTGTAQGLNPPAAVKMPVDTGKNAGRRPPRMPVLPRDTVRVRVIGRTVDIQALTRFYRNLEDSPFLGAVQLVKSETQAEGGKDINQFTMDFMFTRPDSTLVRRVPMAFTQR